MTPAPAANTGPGGWAACPARGRGDCAHTRLLGHRPGPGAAASGGLQGEGKRLPPLMPRQRPQVGSPCANRPSGAWG